MSQVAINVDTEAKLVSVTVDGTAVENVNCVRVDKYSKEDMAYGPEFELTITTVEKSGDIKKHTTLRAVGSKLVEVNELAEQYNRRFR